MTIRPQDPEDINALREAAEARRKAKQEEPRQPRNAPRSAQAPRRQASAPRNLRTGVGAAQNPSAGLPGAPANDAPRKVLALSTEKFEDEWPTHWLPAPVRDWVEAAHDAFAVPRVMAIATALCAASTLVQGKARVRVKDGWEEPLCLFWVVSSPTGSLKSAVLHAGTKAVRDIQEHVSRELSAEITRVQNDRARWDAQLSRLRRQVKAHQHTDGYQQHLADIRELEHQLADNPVPVIPRWTVADVNPALLPRLLRRNQEAEGMARLAILEAEGTFLWNMLGRHSKGSIAIETLLKAYTGEPIEVVRASQSTDALVESFLPAAWMTILALVQPHVLDAIKGAGDLADNGALGRFIVSQLGGRPVMPPADAPRIPDAVQSAYDAWLWQLHALPADTVVDLSAQMRPGGALHALYGQVAEFVATESGAVGWARRAVGRVSRIYALSTLLGDAGELSQASNTHTAPPARVCANTPELLLLIEILYSRALSQAQAIEPHRSTLSHLAHRALAWLRHSDVSTARTEITERELIRGLRLSKAQVEALCDELLSTGHVEVASETKNRNRTVTVTYRIVSTDPLGDERPKPQPVPTPTSGDIDESEIPF